MKSLKKDQLKSKTILGVSKSTVVKTVAVLGIIAGVASCEPPETCDNDTTSTADPASSSSDTDVTSFADDC